MASWLGGFALTAQTLMARSGALTPENRLCGYGFTKGIEMTNSTKRLTSLRSGRPSGVLGITVGFAAQRSIATVLAGFQIALTQPIRLDDVVIVED
jgi:hypothetical protein